MSTSKHIDKICIAIISITLILTLVFMGIGTPLSGSTVKSVKYEKTLFDTSYVHKIDIVMDNWDTFIKNCESEEYSSCSVVIDGVSYKNIAIRAKGNTSLSNVSSMDSQRYSFKLEFDHYEKGKTCDGLDKLCLNNLIQDNTMMKDYIVYQMMNDFGVDSPLCSFAYITMNGEDWGLYLAVEGIEDSFLSRNYGSDTGELYKPDSMSFGGGRGNGKDFNMNDFEENDNRSKTETTSKQSDDITQTMVSEESQSEMLNPASNGSQQGGMPQMPDGQQGDFPQTPGSDGQPGDFSQFPGGDGQPGDFSQPPGVNGQPSESETQQSSEEPEQESETQQNSIPQNNEIETQNPQMPSGAFSQNGTPQMPGGMGGGFGSNDDVKLKYIDDDPDSYSNIFSSAKTDVSDADKDRLISALKNLSEYSDLENTLEIEKVLRYFVIHNFVCNGDSYTGSMIHNYYLHEKDGKLEMIPWDYNLAFGTFQGGNASSSVNASIDSPVSGGSADDRPMVGWIFSDEAYTNEYHELFSEFITKWFSNGELEKMIEDTAQMIRPYVEKDPTKFCTLEDFDKGVSVMSQFVSLRAQAVGRQLKGDNTAVEVTGLNLSDMGSMGGNMDGGKSMNFDFSSSLTLKDKNGNEVDISEVIGDISSVKSVTLSDGTTFDVSSFDMKSISGIDMTKAVSVTCKDGKTIDLSEYSISFSTSKTDRNNAHPENKTDGESSEVKNSDTSESETNIFSKQTQSGNRPDGNMNSDSDGSFPGDSSKTSGSQIVILLIVSVMVLAVGVLIAMKKKIDIKQPK